MVTENPLLSLEEAKNSIGSPLPSGASDEEIRKLIAAVVPIIEDIVGPIVPRTCDEWHDGGADIIGLHHYPIISITSVAEVNAGVSTALTAQPLDGAGPFTGYGYTVDLETGILRRRAGSSCTPFARGAGNVHIVYIAGREEIPGNLNRAARRLFRHLWQPEKQGGRPNMGAAEGTGNATTPSGYVVPRVVMQLCGVSDTLLPGFA
jgi:hypothetical protein